MVADSKTGLFYSADTVGAVAKWDQVLFMTLASALDSTIRSINTFAPPITERMGCRSAVHYRLWAPRNGSQASPSARV